MSVLFRSLSLLATLGAAAGSVVFEDGFEAEALGIQWKTSTTNAGRAATDTQHAPATGARHLVLDDSINDAVSSVAEAILQVDLANMRNVVLVFKVKSIGNEADAPPTEDPVSTRAFDGVSVSLDQGASWHLLRSLSTVGSSWERMEMALDSHVSSWGDYGRDFRIRFSAYDNGPAPLDGIAIDDVAVSAELDQRSLFELPSLLVEGGGPQSGHIVLGFASPSPLTLDLSASLPGQIVLPSTVTVPAGETAIGFSFSVADDSLLNQARQVTLRAAAPGVMPIPITVIIQDDEMATARLTLSPSLAEGATPNNNATLALDVAPSPLPLTIALAAVPSGEVAIPGTLVVPVGQKQVAFTARAVNDLRIDGDVVVKVTATSPSIMPVSVETTAVDNEARVLTFTLPATLLEGSVGAGSVKTTGTLPTDLRVTLAGASEQLELPPVVTLKAGTTQTAFSVAATDNPKRDGTRTVTVTAEAPGFPVASRPITIQDNDVASYRFEPPPAIVDITNPVTLSLSAFDIEGNGLGAYAGAVNLSIILPDESLLPVVPALATLTGGAWTGSVTLPAISSAPLRVKASDAADVTGETPFFDIMRVLKMPVADLVWDAKRERIYASVGSSAAAHANRVVAIDPLTGSVTGSTSALVEPGRLLLTSGAEFLYAAVNGKRTIAKIDPAIPAVVSTFEVGNDPEFGVMSVLDMCAVSGQPETLVIAQGRENGGGYLATAAYDSGVARPLRTRPGSPFIEPSGDPAVFYGHDEGPPEWSFRRLELTPTGMRKIEQGTRLFGDELKLDFRTAGNLAISDSGIVVDGPQLFTAGRFWTEGGRVCPDLAADRVYFLERQAGSFEHFDALSAFNVSSWHLVRRLPLPLPPVTLTSGFLRWGINGLAYKTSDSLVLVNASQLVPSGPATDLVTTIEATPNPYPDGSPITFTVRVRNDGDTPARWVVVEAGLDAGNLHQAIPSRGSISRNRTTVFWPLAELAPDATESLTITTLPASGEIISCMAIANASSPDSNPADNRSAAVAAMRFEPKPNAALGNRLHGLNALYDPKRRVIWTPVPLSAGMPLGGCVVSYDPANGKISNPIPLQGNSGPSSIALSENGRYLFVGLTDLRALARIDLEANPPQTVHYQLRYDRTSPGMRAGDLEVLEGDGTSVLMASEDAVVFDPSGPRADRIAGNRVVRVERTAVPGLFVGLGPRWTRTLVVTNSGVSIVREVLDLFPDLFTPGVDADGAHILSSTGLLIESDTLNPVFNFAVDGRPCLDDANHRAFIVRGSELRGFDTRTMASLGALPLAVNKTGDWAKIVIRWGLDGFLILDSGSTELPLITRWSQAIAPDADTNGNHVADAWEAAHLGPFGGPLDGDLDGDGIANALEYFFGTSPGQFSHHPLQVGVNGQEMLRLTFPRRAGLAPGFYGFEVSSDLRSWTAATEVNETVLATQGVDGVTMETIEASIPWDMPQAGFIRIRSPKP